MRPSPSAPAAVGRQPRRAGIGRGFVGRSRAGPGGQRERAPPPRRRGLRRYFLAYVGFLGLNSFGLATLGGFFFFWGWVFVGSTVCVLLVKQDEHRAQEGSAGS